MADVLFWVLIALLTAAAIMGVLLPLGRQPRGADAAAHERQVYLDQLKELERDKADGRVAPAEAEAARTEIARRLLAAEPGKGGAAPRPAGRPMLRRATAIVALIGIPALSLSLYLTLGAPDLPGAPLAARLQKPSDPNDVEMLIARVEQHLAENPEDGRGWEVIAPVYYRLGRVDDAARAYRNAIRLNGSRADLQAGLGEALVAAEGGIVTADARAAFAAASELDKTAPGPRFFLGLAAKQEGKTQEAMNIWQALLNDAPDDAPWRETVAHALAGAATGTKPPGPSIGPTPADVAAADDMAPEDRMKMIEGMVSQLAERLKANPDDADGWTRLIRSYAILGRAKDAKDAARDALQGVTDPAGKSQIQSLLADIGLVPGGAAGAGMASAEPAPGATSAPGAQPPGPSAADVAAAQQMTPEDRKAMIEGMVGRLAERLKEQPDDLEGWLRLIRSYSVLGHPRDAMAAAQSALEGVKDPDGQAQIKAMVADLGLAATPQASGQTAGAAPAESAAPVDAATTAPPGPSAADVAAAQQMTPEDRNSMIEGMVGRLADRLKEQPDDVEGWLRLIRSYAVLGHSEDAMAAAGSALKGVSDSAGRNQITALVAELGLTPATPAPSGQTASAAPAQGAAAAPGAPPGPSAADVAAAQQMTPDDRNSMIEGMVGRLADRLKGQPDDVEGWLRLIRSYSVLGRESDAAAAARSALDGVTDPAGQGRIKSLIADLGVTPAATGLQ